MAIDKVVSASITDSAVTDAKLSFNSNQFRNIIINGDMSIAQRSTSASSIASNGYHSCDRWRYAESSSAVVTISQATDVPTGQGFAKSFKIDCTTADASLGAAEYVLLQQKIEGQNLQYIKKGTSSAESLTLSFWVKSTKTGTFIAMLYDRDNTRQIAKSYTVSSSDTWEKKTITFAGDTSGTLDNDNASSLELWLWLGVGSNYSSGTLATSWETETAANQAVGQVNALDSTSNNFLITGVQLEVGTAASDFEFLPFDVNLSRCERYYQKSFAYGTAPADNLQKFEYHSIEPYSSGNMAGLISYYKTEMRTIPTVTVYTTGQGSSQGTGKISWYNGSGWGNASVNVQAGSTEKCFHLDGSSFTNMRLAQFNFEATAEL